MHGGSSRLNKEQQVKVVVRLKPEQSEMRSARCVYLSEQQNHLVVQTDYKKEPFVFDHVAHQMASQLDIYQMIGAEAVATSLQGYNCCIFAYGQTGAGKTYSIMGDILQLQKDPYCESRGILPRLLEDLFNLTKEEQTTTYEIICSYIEIYNQQIYDLLSTDKRVHQIREDHRKGVFIEGVVETKLASYRQAVDLLLEGDKTRKIAYTSMNTESSRSHVIFSVVIEAYTRQDQLLKVKKSKLNIVDLAGSERVKYTNVEGERLREGCNINKSLHVLGNVINSLVQSAKKKKHIPYRDSKLTYFLKDSLGGNSITKLLANIHCGKQFYGDTLSTLMFAKRAKILKMRVEVNENYTQNFQSLRKQVRKLRQELAEARYFKDQKSQRTSFYQDFQQTLERITDNSDYEVAPKLEIIQVFEQNQLHFKALIQIYEEHMHDCKNSSFSTRRNSINKVCEWKNLQKRNVALTNLIRQFPAFTKIYKENLLLKQDKAKGNYDVVISNQYDKKESKKATEETTFMTIKQPDIIQLEPSNVDEIIKIYENIIDEMRTQFTEQIETLERSYSEIEQQLKMKDKKIKQLIRQQDKPPDIQQLRNQNQYLQLNILTLQNQIKQLQENETKMNVQRRQSKRSHRKSIHEKQNGYSEEDEELISYFQQKLMEVHKQAEKEAEIAEQEHKNLENIIIQLSTQVTSLINQNNRLQLKHKRSGSQRKSREKYQSSSLFQSEYKNHMFDFCMPKQMETFIKTTSSDNAFKDAQSNFTKQMMTLRLEIKMKHKEIVDLKEQIELFQKGDQKIEEEFGKSLDDIIKEYRQIAKKQAVATMSMRNIRKYKDSDHFRNAQIQPKISDKNVSKKSSVEAKVFKRVQTQKNIKRIEPDLLTSSKHNSKTNFFQK